MSDQLPMPLAVVVISEPCPGYPCLRTDSHTHDDIHVPGGCNRQPADAESRDGTLAEVTCPSCRIYARGWR